jgi:hypothetical protein
MVTSEVHTRDKELNLTVSDNKWSLSLRYKMCVEQAMLFTRYSYVTELQTWRPKKKKKIV